MFQAAMPQNLSPAARDLAAFLLATAALAAALISEHGFGWTPCELCLWQRWPYYLGAPVLAVMLWRGGAATAPLRQILRVLAALIFLVGFGLGVWHSLVEFGLAPGLSSCGAATISQAGDFSQFLAETTGKAPVNCNARTPYLFGLSMANLNAFASLAITMLLASAQCRVFTSVKDGGQ